MSDTQATVERSARNWIDGAWTDETEHRDSLDPATGQVIGTYAVGSADSTNRAIAAASRAFQDPSWTQDRLRRSRVLNRMADVFERRAGELVDLLALENGKVKAQGALEVAFAPETLRFNAALALTDVGTASVVTGGEVSMVLRQPVGVAGIIAPWNSPVALGIRSLAPALAAGCTTVMSLPRQTAQTNALIAELISEVDELPVGAVNVITGGGFATGDVLVRSPDVPTLSFTGSTKTGAAIGATAAANWKRVGLELGGKTPMILFADADLATAVPLVVTALVVFAGQFCMTGSRVLVHESIADEVRAELVRQLGAVVVGPASDPASQMGPIISKQDVARIDGVVEDALAKGATALLRGGPRTTGPLADGNFYDPVLLETDDNGMAIVQDEIFGPVLTMQVFSTEAEAVALANGTVYGLSASVFTRDVDRALRVAGGLDAGSVWINDWAKLHDQFEEGGFKASGVGRMRGFAVIDDFVEHKHIRLHPGTPA